METNTAALETLYEGYCADHRHSTALHLPTLRDYAGRCDTVIELGCKLGHSATALILGSRVRALSVDIQQTESARRLERLAGDKWRYVIADSRTVELPRCGMMFVDSLHTYAQVEAELRAHAHRVTRYLLFHDWLTAGSVSLVGETGRQSWQHTPGQSVPQEHLGIMPAILELMARDPSWRVRDVITHAHGLLVLERHS